MTGFQDIHRAANEATVSVRDAEEDISRIVAALEAALGIDATMKLFERAAGRLYLRSEARQQMKMAMTAAQKYGVDRSRRQAPPRDENGKELL